MAVYRFSFEKGITLTPPSQPIQLFLFHSGGKFMKKIREGEPPPLPLHPLSYKTISGIFEDYRAENCLPIRLCPYPFATFLTVLSHAADDSRPRFSLSILRISLYFFIPPVSFAIDTSLYFDTSKVTTIEYRQAAGAQCSAV